MVHNLASLTTWRWALSYILYRTVLFSIFGGFTEICFEVRAEHESLYVIISFL